MLSLRASELTRVMMSEADVIEGLFRALFEEGKMWGEAQRELVLFRSCSGIASYAARKIR